MFFNFIVSELMSKADNTIKQRVDSKTSETPHLYDYDSNTNPSKYI